MADINRIIKEARNTLVGKVPDPQSQIDQITLALIYKFMDAKDKEAAVAPFVEAAKVARKLGLGLNAGHDLNLENLNFFYKNIPWLDEVSIGHALISDALYLGLQRTIQEYKKCLS